MIDPSDFGLTSDEAATLLSADALHVACRVDLLDDDDQVVDDLTPWVLPAGSQVDRGVYRTIHGHCRLRLSRRLDWGRVRVRPWMRYYDPASGLEVEVPRGVYLLATPITTGGSAPTVWEVDGYDKLEVLAHPYGQSLTLEPGVGVLAAIRQLIEEAGEDRLTVIGSGDDVPLPTHRTWPLDEQTTRLNIINDLAGAINYRGLWVDERGSYVLEPYGAPADQAAAWAYDADAVRSVTDHGVVVEHDFFDVPNRWVFVLDDPEAEELPEVGDGIFIHDNLADGPTSQEARGRVITAVHRVDAPSHAALEAAGWRTIRADMDVARRATVEVGSNPFHAHFDVVALSHGQLGLGGRWLVTDWTLPLDGSRMRLETRQVDG